VQSSGMMEKDSWVVYAGASAVLWGISYASVKLVNIAVSSFVINMVHNLLATLFNLYMAYTSGVLKDVDTLTSRSYIVPFLMYSMFSIGASFCFFRGYRVPGANPGTFVAISGSYPIITFLISYIFLYNRNVNLYVAIPGIIVTCTGVLMVSLS
ncbi:hypothetical protein YASMINEVIRUS_622, partial [Yasminevirus sp. GU-2018]